MIYRELSVKLSLGFIKWTTIVKYIFLAAQVLLEGGSKRYSFRFTKNDLI